MLDKSDLKPHRRVWLAVRGWVPWEGSGSSFAPGLPGERLRLLVWKADLCQGTTPARHPPAVLPQVWLRLQSSSHAGPGPEWALSPCLPHPRVSLGCTSPHWAAWRTCRGTWPLLSTPSRSLGLSGWDWLPGQQELDYELRSLLHCPVPGAPMALGCLQNRAVLPRGHPPASPLGGDVGAGPWAAPGSRTHSGCLLSKVDLLPFCRQDALCGFVPRVFVLCCPCRVGAGKPPGPP